MFLLTLSLLNFVFSALVADHVQALQAQIPSDKLNGHRYPPGLPSPPPSAPPGLFRIPPQRDMPEAPVRDASIAEEPLGPDDSISNYDDKFVKSGANLIAATSTNSKSISDAGRIYSTPFTPGQTSNFEPFPGDFNPGFTFGGVNPNLHLQPVPGSGFPS